MSDTNASASPYALLHLREGAPRDLVDETYWLLVRRLKYGVTEDVEGLRQLDRLNVAYESIVRNGVRQVTAGNGVKAERGRRWSRGKNRTPVVADPYETLFVTEDADPDIALLASKVLAGRPPSEVDGREWNSLVKDAAAQLAARWSTAQSANGAESIEDTGADVAARATAEPAEAPADEAHSDAAPVADATDVETVSVSPVERANEPELPQPAVAVEPETAPHMIEAERTASDHLDELAASVAPAALVAPASDTTAVPSGTPGVVLPATVPPATPEAPRPRGWMDRLRGRSEERAAMVEAENDRLLSLCDGDGAEAEHAPHGNGHHASREAAAVAHPELRVVAQGPVTLELTPDEGYDFLIGDPSDPAHIQIWRQSGRYLLQQVAGPVASVGGAALESPIVVLEDGDEVACGGDVVLIRFGAARASDVAPAQA